MASKSTHGWMMVWLDARVGVGRRGEYTDTTAGDLDLKFGAGATARLRRWAERRDEKWLASRPKSLAGKPTTVVVYHIESIAGMFGPGSEPHPAAVTRPVGEEQPTDFVRIHVGHVG